MRGIYYWLAVVAVRYFAELLGKRRWAEATIQVLIGAILFIGYIVATEWGSSARDEQAVCLTMWVHRDLRSGLSCYQIGRVAGLGRSPHLVIRKMEKEGLVTAWWGDPSCASVIGKPMRLRFYKLSQLGRKEIYSRITPPPA